MKNVQYTIILETFDELLKEGLNQAPNDKSKEFKGYKEGLKDARVLLKKILEQKDKLDPELGVSEGMK